MGEISIEGQTALITGASSGIGKACAELFALRKVNLVLGARRIERLEALKEKLSSQYGIKVKVFPLDVQDSNQVDALFSHLQKEHIAVDILINNAGLALSTDKMQEGNISNWDTMIDTNIKGLLYMTRAALPSMIKKNQGHIVNIGSTAGHTTYPGGNIYSATKHAVRAISESLRIDLLGSKIRVSEIDPGAVHTEFSEVRWNDKEKAKKLYEGFIPLSGEDIADAILYCLTRPLHVNVSEIIIFPQAQASLRDIYREGAESQNFWNQKS